MVDVPLEILLTVTERNIVLLEETMHFVTGGESQLAADLGFG